MLCFAYFQQTNAESIYNSEQSFNQPFRFGGLQFWGLLGSDALKLKGFLKTFYGGPLRIYK
jgi:hypothetical protein